MRRNVTNQSEFSLNTSNDSDTFGRKIDKHMLKLYGKDVVGEVPEAFGDKEDEPINMLDSFDNSPGLINV